MSENQTPALANVRQRSSAYLYAQTASKTPRAIFAIFLLCIAIAVGGWKMSSNEAARKQQLVTEATSLTREYGIAVERRLKVSVSSLFSLASVMQVDESGVVATNFESIAKTQIDLYGGISNLQFAPGGIVTTISPLEGNEGAIGHNIMVDTKRRGGSLATIEKQDVVFVGPLTLTQGGVAVIARYPVFTTYADIYVQNDDYKNKSSTIDCSTEAKKKENCYFPGPKTAAGNATHFYGFVNMLTLIDDVFLGLGFDKLANGGYNYRIYKKGQTSSFFRNQDGVDTPLEEAIVIPISYKEAGVEWVLETARKDPEGVSEELLIQIFLLVLVIAQSSYSLFNIISSEHKKRVEITPV